jgi:hypothetical protein
MILMTLALTLAPAPPDGRWLHVGGSNDGYQEYVDQQSIVRSGDKVTVWTRRDFADGPATVWHELEFDCHRRTETVLAYIRDDGKSVSHNTARPHRKASPVPPDSGAEKTFAIVCPPLRKSR